MTETYRPGGAEYGAPQYQTPQAPGRQQPSMRPAAQQAQASGWAETAEYREPLQTYSAAGPSVPQPAQPTGVAKSPSEVVLSKPYNAHGSDVQVVSFREPTVPEIRRLGYPLRNGINAQGIPCALEELPDVVGHYISLLSKPPLPPSTINSMTPADFSRCSSAVLNFFLG